MSEDVPQERRDRIAADPFGSMVGVELVSLAPGRAEAQLEVAEAHLNFHGTPHGGAIYTLADAAFAAASNADGETAVALETNLSYFEAVDAGTTLVATAEAVHRSRRTGSYEVEVATADGEPVAAFRGRVYRP